MVELSLNGVEQSRIHIKRYLHIFKCTAPFSVHFPSQISLQEMIVKISKGAPIYSQLAHIWGWPKPHLLSCSWINWIIVFCIVLECGDIWPHQAKWLRQEDPIRNFGNFTTKTYNLTEVPRTTNIRPVVHSSAPDSPALRWSQELPLCY